MSYQRIKRALSLLAATLLAAALFAAPLQARETQAPPASGIAAAEPSAPAPVTVKQLNSPLVLIDKMTTDPAPVIPGEPFTLKVKLKNHGNREARRIVLTLLSLEGESTLKHFSPLGQSNVLCLNRLPVEAEQQLQCKMIAGPGASGGIYNLLFHLSYIDPAGTPQELTAVSGVILQQQGTLDLIEMSYPRSVSAGEPFTVSGYVVNSGSAPVRGVGLIVRPGEKFEAQPGEIYFGTFNEGDSDSFDLEITALKPGENSLGLELYYSDAMNRKQTLEEGLPIEVLGEEEEQGGDSAPGKQDERSFWTRVKTFFAALFGLGGS